MTLPFLNKPLKNILIIFRNKIKIKLLTHVNNTKGKSVKRIIFSKDELYILRADDLKNY